MAKKKAKMGRPKLAEGALRGTLITFRCRAEYKQWVADFAKAERINPSQLFDLGLIELAKQRGYPAPPER